MTLQNFFNKYNCRYLDYDGAFGNQCVDVMRAYVKEVYGLNPYTAIPPRGNAKYIFKSFVDNADFIKILNGRTNAPESGDIIFFKTSLFYPWLYGFAGHVEIVDQADSMNMINFAQNWPTGSPCHYQKRKYKDCLGWLHRR